MILSTLFIICCSIIAFSFFFAIVYGLFDVARSMVYEIVYGDYGMALVDAIVLLVMLSLIGLASICFINMYDSFQKEQEGIKLKEKVIDSQIIISPQS